jgi:hypothetical protein
VSEFDRLQDTLDNGINAAKAGDAATARKLLKQVVKEDPDNELALMWLASSVTSSAERRLYLQQVVRINPNNQRARQALAQLSTKDANSVASVARQVEQDQSQQRQGSGADDFDEEGGVLSSLSRFEIGLLVALAFAIGAGFLAFNSFSQPERATPFPTFTPSPVTPSSTPRPTDPVAVIVTPEPQELPPTFTPTPTNTPTDTPTPTFTPFPLIEFDAMLLERAPEDTNSTLFQVDGLAENATLLGNGIYDVTYDLSGQTVAIVKEVVYPPDEQYDWESTVTEIFIAPVDNLDAAEQVTFTRIASAHSPSFSPDGNYLVFASDFDGDDDLWLLDIRLAKVSPLTDNDAQDRDPDWSPDGTRIVFASNFRTGTFEIFMLEFVALPSGQSGVDVNQHTITQLTTTQGNNIQPKWSDDAQWITLINDGDGDGDVVLMDKDGLRRQVLTLNDEGAEDKNPSFTPDRQYISFASNREDEKFQIYLASFNGREVIRLTDTDNIAETIDYRPMLIFRVRPQN